MGFADALRLAMNGETQVSLADRSGLKQSSISKYLSGSMEPTLRQLDILERALPRLRSLRSSAESAVA